ncbi:hypothetical protein MMC29_001068 [Sticta canariensis]|nr:hypothetical protein [Sticta canariensis]
MGHLSARTTNDLATVIAKKGFERVRVTRRNLIEIDSFSLLSKIYVRDMGEKLPEIKQHDLERFNLYLDDGGVLKQEGRQGRILGTLPHDTPSLLRQIKAPGSMSSATSDKEDVPMADDGEDDESDPATGEEDEGGAVKMEEDNDDDEDGDDHKSAEAEEEEYGGEEGSVAASEDAILTGPESPPRSEPLCGCSTGVGIDWPRPSKTGPR